MVRLGDDQLGGDDRSDAGLGEQPRRQHADVAQDLALELGGLERRRFGSSRQAAEDEPAGRLVRGCP